MQFHSFRYDRINIQFRLSAGVPDVLTPQLQELLGEDLN
jgi:hypothetical protein